MTRRDRRGPASDREAAHRNWVTDIAEAKQLCREYQRLCEERGVPSDAILVTQGMSVEQARALRGFHGAALDYREQLAPWASRLEEQGNHWSDELLHVGLPDGMDGEGLPPLSISLATLDEWRMTNFELVEESVDMYGDVNTSTETVRVFLPATASSAVYQRCNSCVDDLGLAADVADLETEIVPPPKEEVYGE